MHICHNYITVSQNYLSRLVETISYFSNNQKKKQFSNYIHKTSDTSGNTKHQIIKLFH